MNNLRGNKNARLIALLIIIAMAAGLWYYGNKTDNKTVKTIAAVTSGVAAVATGLEVADKDFDLGKMWDSVKNGDNPKEALKKSLLARDKDGNLIRNPSVICDAQEKKYYNFNCKDFLTQEEAQKVHEACKAKTGKDNFRLDGDKDGEVCESLPKKKK